jgi:predicted RNase H-like HicB family nuclease
MAITIHKRATNLSQLGYTIELLRDRATDGDYIYLARNPELEGCMAQGLTEKEALENLSEIRIEHIEHLLEFHLPIPIPNHAIASSTISNEAISTKDVRNISFPGFEFPQTENVQAEECELVYSINPPC